MPVSHAPETTVTSENRDEKKVPGLLEVLAQVPDLRKRRGRRYRAGVRPGGRGVLCAGRGEDLPGDRRPGRGPAAGRARPPRRPHPSAQAHDHRSRARSGSAPSSTPSTRMPGRDHRRLAAGPGAGREAGAAADRDRDRRQVAARHRRRHREAVRRDAAGRKGHHRPAPHPREHQRDHPGQRAAGRHRPGELPS